MLSRVDERCQKAYEHVVPLVCILPTELAPRLHTFFFLLGEARSFAACCGGRKLQPIVIGAKVTGVPVSSGKRVGLDGM